MTEKTIDEYKKNIRATLKRIGADDDIIETMFQIMEQIRKYDLEKGNRNIRK